MALASTSTLLGVERAWADSVIATIPVGNSPFTVVVNPNTGNVYVGNDVGTVSVISPSNQVIATIPVGIAPAGIAFNPNNGNVCVSNSGNGQPGNFNTVSVISSSTNQVIATIPVGMAPFVVAVNPNTGNVYVINVQSNTVSVISPNNQVISTIPVGNTPQDIAVNPNTGNIYVANIFSDNISVISGTTNQVIATIPVSLRPQYLVVNPNTANVYVPNFFSNTVSVLSGSTNQVTATIPVGTAPVRLALNPNTGNVYVVNSDSNTVSAISPFIHCWSDGPKFYHPRIPSHRTPALARLEPQQASIRLATARENRAVLKRKHFDRDAQENNKLTTTKVKTEEEELEEFRTRWYNENITIQKVVRLEQFLGHPVDLWDLYSCARFSNEEIDWLDENGVLYWLLDGPILSASDGQLLIDGSNSSLCDIIRICPQDQDLSKFIGVAMV